MPTACAVPAPRSFATGEASEGVAADEVKRWERHNAESLVPLSCRVPPGVAFRAAQVNLQLERIHLALVRGTAHAVVRDEPLVKAAPVDSIAVYAALCGDALVEHAGKRRVIRPGQLLVCDVDRPFLRGFGHGLEELAVKVPRADFTALTGLATVEQPIVVDAGPGADPYGRALVRLVGRAVRASSAVPADEQAILELVSVVATGGAVSLGIAHRAAARAFIDDHLADPTLSAADVAAAAGVSERHLSRLFSCADTSVPRHILARRLDLAYSMLRQGAQAVDRTADVAERCGFTSASYFSTAFRRRFGVTAGEVLRGAAA